MKRLSLMALLLVALFVLQTGCDGCREDVDDDAQERIDALSTFVPATTDAAIIVPEIGAFPQTVDHLFKRLEHFNPQARAPESALRQNLGLHLSDPESWDQAGFDLDGSLMISMVGSRPVLTAHIDDSNAFETYIVGRLRQMFDTQTSIERQDYGDRRFRTSGTGPSDDMAWFIDGHTVVLVMPPADTLDVFATGSAASVATELGGVDEDNALRTSPAFQDFRRGIDTDYPISFFVDVNRYLERDIDESDSLGMSGLNDLIRSAAQWSQDNAGGAGFGLKTDAETIQFRGYAAGDEEILAQAAEAYQAEADLDWAHFLTDQTTLATRTSFDLSSTVETYLESLPDDHRRNIQREMTEMGRDLDMDFDDDILGAFSGHTQFIFYGFGEGISRVATALMGGQIERGIQNGLAATRLALNVHFDDIDKVEALLGVAEEHVAGLYHHRNSATAEDDDNGDEDNGDDAQSTPIHSKIHGNTFSLFTAAIDADMADDLIAGESGATPLADSDHPLGQRFATDDALNGLYLNFSNLRSNMRNIPLLAGYTSTIDALHELMITAEVEDHGIYLDATLQFSDPLEDN